MQRSDKQALPAAVESTATSRARAVLIGLSVLLGATVAIFLTWGVDGHWDYALPRRLEQLAALAAVGVAVATSTVVFQTLTQNRILTPSIMGFDALYVLLGTVLVFVLGSTRVNEIPDLVVFLANAVLLISVATAAYRWILFDLKRGLYTLVLVGVIASTMFASITTFLLRVMNPNEFDALVGVLYASFNVIDTTVLGIASVLLVAGSIATIREIPVLDVLTVGRERAITLGIDYQPTVTRLLVIVAVLVSVSTALVGPIVFLGLLVANLAYQLTGTYRHAVTLPAAALIGVVALVLGQTILQHVLHYSGTLGSIVNLIGGVYFVVLLLREART